MAIKNRPSNVVREMAKLERNREERRRRQVELKEERKTDPNNPNRDLIAMIRLIRGADCQPPVIVIRPSFSLAQELPIQFGV